ncbi:hypothetical protein B0I37DRAFT_381704 [Chaetomium sp. MPI-CAGE-AT-0009]|nr:hypothetical protein B0I37DRAFT_381704 [Chaetomium sp. MPI-CAGE-AT-0009]
MTSVAVFMLAGVMAGNGLALHVWTMWWTRAGHARPRQCVGLRRGMVMIMAAAAGGRTLLRRCRFRWWWPHLSAACGRWWCWIGGGLRGLVCRLSCVVGDGRWRLGWGRP